MRAFNKIENWISARKALKHEGLTLGFVPTMGALHQGHLSLVKRARSENDRVLVSIFVNPTQFNNPEDLAKYPRTLDDDLKLLIDNGVDFVLLPEYDEMYADNYRFKVTDDKFGKMLCGVYRPGHFDGVLTVMTKLLNLAQAERCYMGEKDFQQFVMIRDMAKAFFIDTEIVPCPTVREESGLALSSRNRRLSAGGRANARLISVILQTAASCEQAKEELIANGFEVEYCEEHWGRRFVAAQYEGVRLIDNVEI